MRPPNQTSPSMKSQNAYSSMWLFIVNIWLYYVEIQSIITISKDSYNITIFSKVAKTKKKQSTNPGYYNIKVKDVVSIQYTDFRIKVARMWDVQLTIVPVTIGVLGSIPPN